MALLAGSRPARADSIVLRDGRHVHGKFAGGTQGVIAFSSQGATQYYNVAEVLVMTFDQEGEGQGAYDQPSAPDGPAIFLHPQQGKSKPPKALPRKTKAGNRRPQTGPHLLLAVERSH
jgi:hypothetical protein